MSGKCDIVEQRADGSYYPVDAHRVQVMNRNREIVNPLNLDSQREMIPAPRFGAGRGLKHGHRCFVLMRDLGIHEVLTTDRHFTEAGFRLLLPVS